MSTDHADERALDGRGAALLALALGLFVALLADLTAARSDGSDRTLPRGAAEPTRRVEVELTDGEVYTGTLHEGDVLRLALAGDERGPAPEMVVAADNPMVEQIRDLPEDPGDAARPGLLVLHDGTVLAGDVIERSGTYVVRSTRPGGRVASETRVHKSEVRWHQPGEALGAEYYRRFGGAPLDDDSEPRVRRERLPLEPVPADPTAVPAGEGDSARALAEEAQLLGQWETAVARWGAVLAVDPGDADALRDLTRCAGRVVTSRRPERVLPAVGRVEDVVIPLREAVPGVDAQLASIYARAADHLTASWSWDGAIELAERIQALGFRAEAEALREHIRRRREAAPGGGAEGADGHEGHGHGHGGH